MTDNPRFEKELEKAAAEDTRYADDENKFEYQAQFIFGARWGRKFTQHEYLSTHRYRVALTEVERLTKERDELRAEVEEWKRINKERAEKMLEQTIEIQKFRAREALNPSKLDKGTV